MSLKAFRAQHPEYNDVSDRDLADALYKKHYADVPRAEFDKRMGLAPTRPAEPKAPAKGRGSQAEPFRVGTRYKVGSPEYQREVAKIPLGSYFSDPQGNLRQRMNPGAGQPIRKRNVERVAGWEREVTGGVANINRGLLIGDEGSAVLGTLGNVLSGKVGPTTGNPLSIVNGLGNSFNNELAKQRSYEDDFDKRRPWLAAGLQTTGMVPTLFVPGGAPSQMATRGEVVANTAGNAALQAGAAGLLDRGTLAERNNQGSVNALLSGGLGATVGAVLTRAPKGARVGNPGIDKAQKRAWQDPAAMRAKQAEYRAAGIDPALVDVVDDSGRAVVRATASKMTPARQATTEFAEGRAVNLPDRIGGQARRYISSDPRTPDAIRGEIAATRSAQANQQFGAVRDTEISLDPDTVMALRSPRGRAEIKNAADAALNSLDPAEREVGARLNRLASDALDAPGETRITVGMAQQISKTLQDAAERARGPMGAATNDTRLFTGLSSAIRGNARTQVPGYDEALKGYEVNSGLIEATTVGQTFTKPGATDEFVASVGKMSPDQLDVARAGARRSLEAAAGGENPATAPGFARRYSVGAEPAARTNALIGPERGNAFRNALRLEEQALRNANDIAPRGGSQTSLRDADNEVVDGVVSVGKKVITGGWRSAIVETGMNYWRSRGFKPKEAEEFTMLAIDPNRLDAALVYIEQKYGPKVAQQFQAFTADAAIRASRATGAGVAAANQNQPATAATAIR